MIMEIREYDNNDRLAIVDAMEKFQIYLVGIDPLKRLRLMPGYAELYTEGFLKKIADQKGKIYVAIAEDKLVGFIAAVMDEWTEMDLLGHVPDVYARIIELFVDEPYRGTGIGKELMETMEKFLKEAGCGYVSLEVFGPNKAAHEFYGKLGYTDRDYDMLKEL